MRAKDIMTVDPITVTPETTIDEAAKIMSEEHISGLPVVNSEGEMIGIITEGDLLGKHKTISPPGYIEFLGGIIYTESQENFYRRLKQYVAYEVKELMSTEVTTITPETEIEEIATIMDKENIKRLPVVKERKLVGIVSRADLIRTLL